MAFKYGNFLTADLTSGLADDAVSVQIDQAKRIEFSDLLDGDEDAVLVISEEVTGSPTKFEIVRATGTSGNNIDVVRAQEGTDALVFTSNAKITNVLTAERAALLGGTANLDIMPDTDDSKKLGATGTAFSEVHTKELGMKAGDQEFIVKSGTVTATEDSIDLMLPAGGGTIARLEDSVEAHPGCYGGSLCVEPAAESVANAVARGHSEIGDGIHIVNYYTDSGQRKLKLAKYADDGGTLVAELGLGLVPGTGGDTEEPARYRIDPITVDGNEYNYLDVEYEIVGDFETVEGEIPSGFTQELVGNWLENLTFTRQPPGLFVAQKIYGQDISSEDVTASEASIGDAEISDAKVTEKLKIPVVMESPGNDDDTTQGYEKGHVLFATGTSTAYVCISETEGKAQWRPMSRLPNSALTRITLNGRGTQGARGSNVMVPVPGTGGLRQYKRFYIDCEFGYLNQSSSGAVIGDISSQVVDYEQFKDGTSLYAQNGRVVVSYASDSQIRIDLDTGGTNPAETVALWGES